MPEPPALPTLQYADLGVSVERTPSAFRVAISPAGWRGVPTGYVAGSLLLLIMCAVIVAATALPGESPWTAVANALPYLLGFVAVCALVWTRLRQHVIYVVTADRFVRATVWPSGRGSIVSWPRDQIGTVKLNSYNRTMVIQHVGRDLMEFVVSPNRDVTEYIATAIGQALRGEYGDFTQGADVQELLPVLRHSGTMRPATARLMVYLTLLMAAAGLTLFLVTGDSPMGALGFCMLILSVVPVGIAFGTQSKKFWV